MSAPRKLEEEQIDKDLLEIACNLDNQSPETLAPLLDRLLKAGAKDAWLTPIVMKKGRLAVCLQVLAKGADLEKIERLIFNETKTLGLRYYPVTCHRLEKRWFLVQTPWGGVGVKLGYMDGELMQASPEFEDCLALANSASVPLEQVYRAALAAWEALA